MSVTFFVPIDSKPGTLSLFHLNLISPLFLQMAMAIFCFQDLLACLESLESIPEHILQGQEGLCFGDVWFMPARWTLEMQCLGLVDFKALIDQNAFQPPGTPASSISHTTALLLIFHADVNLKDIGHVNIILIMHCQACNFYQQDAICGYMGSIRTDLVVAKKKYGVAGCKLPVQSYALLVGNFEGRIAMPTNPPYYLVYANTYCLQSICWSRLPSTLWEAPQACAMPCFRLLTSAQRESSNMQAAI